MCAGSKIEEEKGVNMGGIRHMTITHVDEPNLGGVIGLRDYVVIPSNFFDFEEIRYLESQNGGDSMIVLWLGIYTNKSTKRSSDGVCVFEWPYTEITFKEIEIFFSVDRESVESAFPLFEKLGIAKLEPHRIIVYEFWRKCGFGEKRETTSALKKWRENVVSRDGRKCRICGESEDINAHHIVAWKDSDDGLRYDIDNGITLCKWHHLMAHDGCWKNSGSKETINLLKSIVMRGKN